MATVTSDYAAVLDFINRTKLGDCFLESPTVPLLLREEQNLLGTIPYLDLGLAAEVGKDPDPVQEMPKYQVFATGWTELEGVMLLTPEMEFDADVRVGLAATNERALRDLLLTFPAGKVGFFYLGGAWMLPTLEEMLEGRVMPSRDGYYATTETLVPCHDFPAQRLGANDYPVVQAQWSESVWQELQAGGFGVHACMEKAEVDALCFHWKVDSWRNEVHGLQAVKSYARPYAESVLTSATQEVVEQGKIATCTANLSRNADYVGAFQRTGYQPFYRVHSYLGSKRGSGTVTEKPISEFYASGGRKSQAEKTKEAKGAGEWERRISSSKDPVLVQFADLAHAAGRRERAQFVAEGITLVQRAIADGGCGGSGRGACRRKGLRSLSQKLRSRGTRRGGADSDPLLPLPGTVSLASANDRMRGHWGRPGSRQNTLPMCHATADCRRGWKRTAWNQSPGAGGLQSRVQIPMAPGQDSLNVGVATGLMLYEVYRQKTEQRL